MLIDGLIGWLNGTGIQTRTATTISTSFAVRQALGEEGGTRRLPRLGHRRAEVRQPETVVPEKVVPETVVHRRAGLLLEGRRTGGRRRRRSKTAQGS